MRTLLVCMMLTLAASATPQAASTTYYVSKSGAGPDGLSWQRAFRTIQEGVNRLQAGDRLIIGPGIYEEEVTLPSLALEDRPTVIQAQYAGRTQLIGSRRIGGWQAVPGMVNVFQAPLLQVTDRVFEKDTNYEYRQVEGLEAVRETVASFFYDAGTLYVQPSDAQGAQDHVIDACVLMNGMASADPAHAIRGTGVGGLRIQGLVFSGYRKYGVFIGNADGCVVTQCTAHHTRRGILFYHAWSSMIADCMAFANWDYYHQEMGNIAIQGLVENCTIAYNVVYDTPQHGVRFYGGPRDGNVLRGNLAYDCAVGVQIKGGWDENDLRVGLGVEGNVAVDSSNYTLSVGSTDVFVNRNTSIRSTVEVGSCSVGGGNRIRQGLNLCVDSAQALEAGRFADPSYYDFRLQSDSPHRRGGPNGQTIGAYDYRGDVFFVSNDGNDASDGTSVASAWRTLAHAATRLQAGQTLYVSPGNYGDLQLEGLVAAEAPTRIRARGKGTVILDGRLLISTCRNLDLEGFTIRTPARATNRSAVDLLDSHAVTLRGNEIVGSSGYGIAMERCKGVSLFDNLIAYCRKGVWIPASSSTIAIRNNILWGSKVQLDFPTGIPSGLYSDYNDLGPSGNSVLLRGVVLPALADLRRLGQDANSIDLTPQFSALANRDYRLRSTSPCRGRGYLDKPIGPGRVVVETSSPTFSEVAVPGVSDHSADIAWRTPSCLSTLLIRWGTVAGNWLRTVELDTAMSYRPHHRYTIRGLESDTRYVFQVGSRRYLGRYPFHYFSYENAREVAVHDPDPALFEDTWDAGVREFRTTANPACSDREIHVRPEGHDLSPGTALAPYRTIRKAAEEARPGDRVLVHSGVYEETLTPLRSGVSGRPIVFQAVEDNGPVILSGKRLIIPVGADLSSRHYVTLRGFTFREHPKSYPAYTTNVSGPGADVLVLDGSNVVVERCVFDGRMTYNFSSVLYYSGRVEFRDNVFVSNWRTILAVQGNGELIATHNSFLGKTLEKIHAEYYAAAVSLRNNFFGAIEGSHQAPKVYVDATGLDMDYNCYYFKAADDYRNLVRYDFRRGLQGAESIQPSLATFAQWRDRGFDVHSFVVEDNNGQLVISDAAGSVPLASSLWQDRAGVTALETRPQGFPASGPLTEFAPLLRGTLALEGNSPLIGRGENGATIGAALDGPGELGPPVPCDPE